MTKTINYSATETRKPGAFEKRIHEIDFIRGLFIILVIVDHLFLHFAQSGDTWFRATNIEGYKIVIANTNKKRSLADSKYNERRAECDASLEALRKVLPGQEYLGTIPVDVFEKHKEPRFREKLQLTLDSQLPVAG